MLPDDPIQDDTGRHDLLTKKQKMVQPLHDLKNDTQPETPAVNVIRGKIAALYSSEPSAKEELAEVKTPPPKSQQRSKHQQFMYELSRSGKPLAEIQTAWHNYYLGLSDQEKHEVWQEFYANHARLTQAGARAERPKPAQPKPVVPTPPKRKKTRSKPQRYDKQSITELKKRLLSTVSSRAQPKSHHYKSLLFGLGMGLLVLFVMMFSFFNERFLAPFMMPGKQVSSTPIILDDTAAVGPEPKIIIPKINAEYPVVYNTASVEEEAFQQALEGGVVHYNGTQNPGELGNAVIFGHSSNNILNPGKYKFAFVLLNRLEAGDTFILHYEAKRYVYRVFEKEIVKPSDLSVLGKTDRPATVTLITCDPPGTALNRLIVVGEQIAPDPAANVASSTPNINEAAQPAILPSNAPSLWSRLTHWFSS